MPVLHVDGFVPILLAFVLPTLHVFSSDPRRRRWDWLSLPSDSNYCCGTSFSSISYLLSYTRLQPGRSSQENSRSTVTSSIRRKKPPQIDDPPSLNQRRPNTSSPLEPHDPNIIVPPEYPTSQSSHQSATSSSQQQQQSQSKPSRFNILRSRPVMPTKQLTGPPKKEDVVIPNSEWGRLSPAPTNALIAKDRKNRNSVARNGDYTDTERGRRTRPKAVSTAPDDILPTCGLLECHRRNPIPNPSYLWGSSSPRLHL